MTSPAAPEGSERNTGVTDSERYLQKLCDRTFLKYWSFPRVFRDERIVQCGGQGKEICDLLVVFQNDILIFSDKSCGFPEGGDPALSWSRWFRRAILKSANQVWGAESWILEQPDRIFLDERCTKRFPIPIPKGDVRFHRIVVAHGASKKCRAFFGGSGTLMIDSALEGKAHLQLSEIEYPFRIGRLDSRKGFVHVFDDESLEVVLKTLDTITDLVNYLAAKEKLLTEKKIIAAGEEELLGRFLMHTRENGEHHFGLEGDFDFAAITEGHWEDYCKGPGSRARSANEISYGWDVLINRFAAHMLAGTQYFTSHPGKPYEAEIGLRYMAAEPRFRRRALVKAFADLAILGDTSDRANRIIVPANPSQPLYVFLCLKPRRDRSHDEYRTVRRNLLEECCYAAKARFPATNHIIGIACGPLSVADSSEDMMYLDASNFTNEEVKSARESADELKLFVNLQKTEMKTVEYPRPSHLPKYLGVAARKIPRNDPCPCGSGLKYKKCCLP